MLKFADSSSAGPFDFVLATAPAPQILQWYPPDFAGHTEFAEARYAPCFTLMLGFDSPLPMRWDAARVKSSALEWLVKGASLPGRSGATLLAHSSAQWASEHLTDSADMITAQLEQALQNLPELHLPPVASKTGHRWLYAELVQATTEPCYLDYILQLGACGDWGMGARVEAAFQSANILADQLIARLTAAP